MSQSDSDIGDIEVQDPGGSKTFSYAYVSLLFLSILGAAVAAVRFGYVSPSVEIQATIQVGWIVEYTVAGLIALFFLWTFAQMANIVGMGFISGLVGAVARIADNYELPRRDEKN